MKGNLKDILISTGRTKWFCSFFRKLIHWTRTHKGAAVFLFGISAVLDIPGIYEAVNMERNACSNWGHPMLWAPQLMVSWSRLGAKSIRREFSLGIFGIHLLQLVEETWQHWTQHIGAIGRRTKRIGGSVTWQNLFVYPLQVADWWLLPWAGYGSNSKEVAETTSGLIVFFLNICLYIYIHIYIDS